MSEKLLPFYNRELDALRGLAREFAQAHPKIAGRLRLADTADDPHVERLLEGVAFLSARVQQRLDDEFPEISDALLDTLYPHYLAPVPSATIVQFTCKPDLRGCVTVPAGTMLETDPLDGEPVRFRTAYDTTLWPLEIESARLSGLPLSAPVNPGAQGARSVLRISLRLTETEANFSELEIDRLRWFLQGPAEQTAPLYELLCGHLVGIALANGPNDDRPTLLPPGNLEPQGFAKEQALYPWPARSFAGFRLLAEYFALPEKFLFVDLAGLSARTLLQEFRQLDVFLYFDRAQPDLERRLSPDCLALGCTPAVNLFPRQCEPIRLDHTRSEYPIVPSYRHPEALEVWRVEQVRQVMPDGSDRPWRPFYRHPAVGGGGEAAGFYNTIRRESGPLASGSDVLLAPFDPALSLDTTDDAILSVDALCTNRDLPRQLPFGGGQPRLTPPGGLSSVSRIRCMTAPTATLRAPLREHRSWRLISHLSMGHLSVVGGAEAAENLREVLCLYDLRDTTESRAAIAALAGVTSREMTARVPGARLGSFCRGLEVTLSFDARAWDSGGLFLLATVLARFLALHATMNSFVATVAVLQGRPEAVARFAPRAGERVLL